jgi:uncharacterized membrane protein
MFTNKVGIIVSIAAVWFRVSLNVLDIPLVEQIQTASLPTFNGNVLILMGISQGLYITSKPVSATTQSK